MTERIKQFTLTRPRLRKAIGIFLILLGFVGIILPVIPGLVLLFIGLELLGMHFLFFDRFRSRKREKAEEIPVTPEVIG